VAYFQPYIDDSGLHIPSYSDIRDSLIQDVKSIYGQDIYLGIDSQDYQLISVISVKIYDTLLAVQKVYNSRGPSTAIGAALDGIVKCNGISRESATYSTCTVTLTGIVSTQIINGIVEDNSGYKWDVPNSIIGQDGTVSVLATCQQPGPISASPGDISKIFTPTYGWTAVTNAGYATVGEAQETDSQLRGRQTISTAQASRSLLEGLRGSIAAVKNVTRFNVKENDTSVVDAEGLPAHSVTVVAEGGLDNDIAQAIFLKKGPGCYTNGTTEVAMTDLYGQPITIRFYRPSYIDVDVVVNVKALSGYTTQTTEDIKTAIVNHLNSISLGVGSIPISSLWGAALSAMTSLTSPMFSVTSITAAKHGEVQGTTDIVILFNEIARGNASYITVNVT